MRFSKHKLAALVLVVVSSGLYANEATLEVIDVTEHSGTKTATDVVTLAQVERSTETDLRGLLSAEPSINFGGGTGGTSQWTTIRGMGQDQIDIKVDNTYTDSQLFHHEARFMLDPSLIKRINVQKGAGSASAGIGATSGSIEATTVEAKDLLKAGQNFGFKVTGGLNSNEGNTYGATIYGRIGQVDALLSGNWNAQQDYAGGKDYRNLLGRREVYNSALNQRGLLAKIGLDLTEDQRVVLSHRQEHYHGERALREEFDFSNSYVTKTQTDRLGANQTLSNVSAGKNSAGKDIFYVLDENGDFLVNTANNNPRYRISNQDTTNLEWTGRNMGFVTEAKGNVYYINRTREEPNTNAIVKYKTVGANLNLDSAIGENHMLKYGVNYRNQVGKPSTLAQGINNQRKQDTGIYVEGIWGFGPVTLTTGGRYDHFKFKGADSTTVSKGHFNPSIGLIWEAMDGLSFNTNLNYATRSPRLYEVMLAGRNAPVTTIGKDTTAEKARNTEIGFNYKLNDAFAFKGSYFWQRVKDAHSIRTVTPTLREIYNGALLRNKGYELSASYQYEGFTARMGVADSSPEVYGNTADNTVFAVKTGRTWTAGLSYKFADPDVELGWKGRFVESETGSPSRGSGSATSVKQEGYNLHDLYASWKANDNFTLNVAIDNVFNKAYRSHSQRAGQNSLPGKGRDFRMNVNYTF